MAGRVGQLGVVGAAQVTFAEGADKASEWLGQQRAIEKVAAKGIGVYFQAQLAEGFTGRVAYEQRGLEVPAFAKHKVANYPIAAFHGGPADAGQSQLVVVDDLRADHGR